MLFTLPLGQMGGREPARALPCGLGSRAPCEGAVAMATTSSSLDSPKQLVGTAEAALPRTYETHPDYAIEPATEAETAFRHSGWAPLRKRVFDALVRCNVSGSVLQAFVECGSGCWVQHSASRGKYRLTSNCCKNRWCVPCGVAKAARLRASVGQQLAEFERVRFVTLTLRHSRTPLTDQLDRLQRSFAALRKRPEWSSCVDGAAAFLEVKVSEKDGLWHPHLHVLCVGSWIDQKKLSAAWHAVTGDSSVVHIELAKGPKDVARYVTAYVTKPLDRTVSRDPARLDEAIIALRGRRLCNGSGTLRTISDRVPDDAALDDWHTIGRLDDLLSDARLGDRAAAEILTLLRDRSADHARPQPPPAPD